MSPARRRQMVGRQHPSLSLVRQCALLGVNRSSLCCRPKARGSLYLVATMDRHSRYVPAWRLSNTLDAGFCAGALEESLARGQPEVFNTGQGSQFSSWEFAHIVQERGVRIGTDGKGRYQDNIFVERRWRTVKYEDLCLKTYASVPEAQRGWKTTSGPATGSGRGVPREPGIVEGESSRRGCSPEEGTQSLAGAPGLSLNAALNLSR